MRATEWLQTADKYAEQALRSDIEAAESRAKGALSLAAGRHHEAAALFDLGDAQTDRSRALRANEQQALSFAVSASERNHDR
jgi:hypothetical protein